jgi:DNA repair protein RecO (recombination protein O)
MLKKTQGIVLNYIKYKETSIIVKIFTRELGLKSYVVNGVRSLGKSNKIALYQPLTLLDLVVYDKESQGLQRISEAKISYPQQQIPFDFTRTSIALFVTELINRSIHDGYQNENLFDFMEESILFLDKKESVLSHFPLIFLLKKAKFLGFAPESSIGFLSESTHQPFSSEEIPVIIAYLEELLSAHFLCTSKISVSLRRKLLDHLLEFYSEQLDQPMLMKSLQVIRQIID